MLLSERTRKLAGINEKSNYTYELVGDRVIKKFGASKIKKMKENELIKHIIAATYDEFGPERKKEAQYLCRRDEDWYPDVLSYISDKTGW